MDLRNRIVIALCCLALLVWPASGTTQAYFTSQESVEGKMLGLIEHTRFSIDMALFELKSAKLVNALEQAQRRGVRVRLLLDTSHRDQDLSAGEVRWLGGKNRSGRGVMHHKFALFDRKEVATGSFNWTPGAEYANYENALMIDDSGTVEAYNREFEMLWQRALKGPLPNGIRKGTNAPERRSKKRHPMQNRLKSIRIRVSKPVIKGHRKTHTNRP